jgi:hypothetical protein
MTDETLENLIGVIEAGAAILNGLRRCYTAAEALEAAKERKRWTAPQR